MIVYARFWKEKNHKIRTNTARTDIYVECVDIMVSFLSFLRKLYYPTRFVCLFIFYIIYIILHLRRKNSSVNDFPVCHYLVLFFFVSPWLRVSQAPPHCLPADKNAKSVSRWGTYIGRIQHIINIIQGVRDVGSFNRSAYNMLQWWMSPPLYLFCMCIQDSCDIALHWS